jgi:hypothetical protein
MSGPSLLYWNDRVQAAQPRVLRVLWNITAAVTATPISRFPVLTAFGAVADQATIDDFLGTTSEFDYLAFDATALGADAMGGVINMGGQVAEVYSMVARCYSNTGGADQVFRCVQDSSALTASTLATEVAKGSSGNIGFRVVWGNTPDFDALTSGTIDIEFLWRSK